MRILIHPGHRCPSLDLCVPLRNLLERGRSKSLSTGGEGMRRTPGRRSDQGRVQVAVSRGPGTSVPGWHYWAKRKIWVFYILVKV